MRLEKLPDVVFKCMSIICLLLVATYSLFSQIGISVSPPRLYYDLNPGETGTQKVLVNNISKEHIMSLSITFGDWKYNELGNNMMFPPDSLNFSCASWLSVDEGTYFTLNPGENREIELRMSVPEETEGYKSSVNTAMVYVTQMNAVDGVDADGAAIKVNVRQGIKVYHNDASATKKLIEIVELSLDSENDRLRLSFNNSGNIWANGTVNTTLFNQNTGDEIVLDESVFYTLPGDKRTMFLPFGKDLASGEYIATIIIDYGDEVALEAAELQFSYE